MEKPDNTAQRTALWRALHRKVDATPLILDDPWALLLARPASGWEQRPDMKYTKPIRASVVGRARFVEEQVVAAVQKGATQYIMLGAGLDSFALRYKEQYPDLPDSLDLYEIDQPATLAWKQACISERLGTVPPSLHFIPVDFEKGNLGWWEALLSTPGPTGTHKATAGENEPRGFDVQRPTVLSCTGVTLYLSLQAIEALLLQCTGLALGSVVIISFYLPLTTLEGEDKTLLEISMKGAAAAGTPMISFFNAQQVLTLAQEAGFRNCRVFNTNDLIERYFTGRTDGLLPNQGELFLVAET